MDKDAILKAATSMLELGAQLSKAALEYTLEKGFIPTDECPLRPTGQHRMLAGMLNGISTEGYHSCPFCDESWYVERTSDYGRGGLVRWTSTTC